MKKGWFFEKYRHSLAAKGVKTSFSKKQNFWDFNLAPKIPFARKDYDDKLRDIAKEMGRQHIPEVGKIETAFENVGPNHVREVQYIYDKDGDLVDERVVDIYKRGVNNELHSLVEKGKTIDLAAKKKLRR